MAKNTPARERPGMRVHGKYAMHNKVAYTYSLPRFLDRETLEELHAARVVAFGHGYYHEARDLEAIAAARTRR
jgi:hypothetical protein